LQVGGGDEPTYRRRLFPGRIRHHVYRPGRTRGEPIGWQAWSHEQTSGIQERQEELLFQAWLGKPLLIYTHRGFFRGGHRPLIEIVEFLEHQVAPWWTGVAEVVSSNYQTRQTSDGWCLRVFSNRSSLHPQADRVLKAVVKPGPGVLPDELAWLDGKPLELIETAGVGVVALVDQSIVARASVEFRPGTEVQLPAWCAVCRRLRRSFVAESVWSLRIGRG
jgi:hypothetical protein